MNKQVSILLADLHSKGRLTYDEYELLREVFEDLEDSQIWTRKETARAKRNLQFALDQCIAECEILERAVFRIRGMVGEIINEPRVIETMVEEEKSWA